MKQHLNILKELSTNNPGRSKNPTINPMNYYFKRKKLLSTKGFQKSLRAHTRHLFKLGIHNSMPENTNKYVLFSEGGDCIGR
jgi:hypothetical protein